LYIVLAGCLKIIRAWYISSGQCLLCPLSQSLTCLGDNVNINCDPIIFLVLPFEDFHLRILRCLKVSKSYTVSDGAVPSLQMLGDVIRSREFRHFSVNSCFPPWFL
jgi:hypothetical protein